MHNFNKPVVKVTTSGIGFPGLLALLFIGLRLSGVIAWPWLWILAPIWIPPAVGLVILAIAGVVYVIADSKTSKPGQSSK